MRGSQTTTDALWMQNRRKAVPQHPSTQLSLTACIVCGSRKFAGKYRQRFPWLVRCRGCGMEFANPQPSDLELGRIYNERYFETFGFDPCDESAYRLLKQANIQRLLLRAERFVKTPGRLLDVGSGVGDVLVVATQRGWIAQGVEPNAAGVSAAERVAPDATYLGTFELFPGPRAHFDLVTCLDVLEHLRRPDQALRKIHELLSPHGLVMVAVPDINSIAARTMGARWPHYHRDHLWYFGPRALSRLFENSGFEVIEHGACWKAFNLRYVAGILASQAHTGMLSRLAAVILHRLPQLLLTKSWPRIPEGQLLLARRSNPCPRSGE